MKSQLLFIATWLISLNSLAQNGADPAVIFNNLGPGPLENVGSVFSMTFGIGNSGAGPITGESDADRMGFYVDLKQCLPNPATVSAVSGTILNAFDITYNPTLNRFEGIQKVNVSLGFATIRRFVVSAVVTQASTSTALNTIGAACTILPNTASLANGPFEPGQPADDDFSAIYTHTNVTAMPVSLVSFTAKAESNQTVLLKWTTSWEKANKGCIIERSKDLKNFERVGEVTDVAGTSNSINSYQFVDRNPYHGTSYYRLRQVDLDGGSHTFNAEVVVIDGQYGVYPNPATNAGFTLSLDEPTTAMLHFYNISGQELTLQKAHTSETTVTLKATENLLAGVYVLTVEERGQLRKHRVVVP